MTTIEKAEVKDYAISGSFRKACSIRPDGDSTEKKAIILELSFDKVPLSGIIEKALRPAVIQWQNGPGRKHWSSWTNNQVVKINFTAPAATPQKDPEEAMIEKLQGMTPEEQKKYLADLQKKAKK